tara:strand:+ start:614 stop:769 length:156 start_codon:yes stop_codon:yes gene_type:complete
MKKGDWVRVLKTGLNGAFQIESIDDDVYTVTQKEGTYVYRIKVKKEEVEKL